MKWSFRQIPAKRATWVPTTMVCPFIAIRTKVTIIFIEIYQRIVARLALLFQNNSTDSPFAT